jgi:hypothetical protein
MSKQQAKYEIVADDKTKSAFVSAIHNINEFHEKFEGLMNAAVVGFTLDKVVEGIHQAVEIGDQMAHAAEKSGIAVEQFSSLSYAAKQLGDVSLESLSTAIKKMQVNLAGNSDAFGKLGLSLEDIKHQAPEVQFEMIGDRIAAIKDPAQKTAAAVAIFGKAGADMIPVFAEGAEGIRKFVEESEKLGVSITKDQAEKLTQADEALKRLDASWQAFYKNLAVNSVRFLQFMNVMDKPAEDRFKELYAQHAKLSETISQIESQKPKEGDSWFKRQLSGYDPTILENFKQQLASVDEQMQQLQERANNGFKPKEQLSVTFQDPAMSEKELKKISDAADELAMAGAQKLYETNNDILQKRKENLDSLDEATKSSIDKRMQYEHDFHDWLIELEEAGRITHEMAVEREDAMMKSLSKDTKKSMDDMTEYAKEASRGIQNALQEEFYDPAKNGLHGLLTSFIDTFRKIISEIAAQKAALALFGNFDKEGNSSGGYLSGFLNSFFGAFGGAKAGGGPVSSGSPYIVGERGPELFVPGMSGSIVPNHALAGGGGVNYSQTNNFYSGQDNQLRQQLPSMLKQTHDQAVASILYMQRQGKLK